MRRLRAGFDPITMPPSPVDMCLPCCMLNAPISPMSHPWYIVKYAWAHRRANHAEIRDRLEALVFIGCESRTEPRGHRCSRRYHAGIEAVNAARVPYCHA